jgi:hypothetical protein
MFMRSLIFLSTLAAFLGISLIGSSCARRQISPPSYYQPTTNDPTGMK